MDKIKRLEINRLVRELEFIESDLEYKSEIIHNADHEFIKSVNTFIDGYPDLKKIYDEKYNKFQQDRIDKIVKEEDEEHVVIDIIDIDSQVIDSKVKNIYRSIAKQTHPDKIDDENLNKLYVDSANHYKNGDILSLYKVCDMLGIEYELEESDYEMFRERIKSVKERIKFMESTFTWAWLNTDDSKKEEILFRFIKLQLG